MERLPFEFERNSEIGLAEQLADGFARAMADGRKLAHWILRVLSGRKLPSNAALCSTYVHGETFG